MGRRAERGRHGREVFQFNVSLHIMISTWQLPGARWGHTLLGCCPPPAAGHCFQLKSDTATSLWNVPERKDQNLVSPLRTLVTFPSVVPLVRLLESHLLCVCGGWGTAGFAETKSAPKGKDAPRKDMNTGRSNTAQILIYFKTTSPERQETWDGVQGLLSPVETCTCYKNLVELSKSRPPLTTAW